MWRAKMHTIAAECSPNWTIASTCWIGVPLLGLVGQTMRVCGWVDRYRNLGGVVFLDIRDHTGVVQVRGGCVCVL